MDLTTHDFYAGMAIPNDMELGIDPMEIRNVHLVYFSPTGTTQSVIRAAAKYFSPEILEYDITDYATRDVQLKFEADVSLFWDSLCMAQEFHRKIGRLFSLYSCW